MSNYNYTEQVKFKKKTASEVVDSLVKLHQADHLKATYEQSLKLVLALHENRELAKVYGRHPQNLIGP